MNPRLQLPVCIVILAFLLLNNIQLSAYSHDIFPVKDRAIHQQIARSLSYLHLDEVDRKAQLLSSKAYQGFYAANVQVIQTALRMLQEILEIR